MSLIKKSLAILVFLGFAGYGVYQLWADISVFLAASGKGPVVVKKISPIKPDFSHLKKSLVSLADKDFTFFETLSDISMKKFIGLNGEILPKSVAPSKDVFIEKKVVAVKRLPRTPLPKSPHLLSPLAAVSQPKVSSPASDVNGKYGVQVSSFRKLDRAEFLMNELRGKGYSPFRIAKEVPEKGVWHRVFIGAYGDEETAMTVAREAWKNERLNAMVVRTEF